MTKKKNKTKRTELEARARSIIADVREHDYDTRLELARALKDKNLKVRDLAGMIAQAEAGELVDHPVLDTFETDYRSNAHSLLRFIMSGLPDFLLDATMTAVNAAAAHFKIEVWKEFPEDLAPSEDYDGQDYSVRALARLLRAADAESFSLDLILRPTLADSIAAVLQHEDTPSKIYNALADGVTDLTHNDTIQNDAAVIALALKVHAQEKGGGDE